MENKYTTLIQLKKKYLEIIATFANILQLFSTVLIFLQNLFADELLTEFLTHSIILLAQKLACGLSENYGDNINIETKVGK